jgi:pyrroloquinoline quinone (PQQ) biosynthesis protein C
MSKLSKQLIEAYARNNDITGLSKPSLIAILEYRDGYSVAKAKQFLAFQNRINQELLQHPVIISNVFTAWFQQGDMSEEQIKAFVVQFSVFSNLFLLAQLQKTINADSLESMRASKEILANEIGVVFKAPGRRVEDIGEHHDDPDLLATQGSVEGGAFHFKAAHFEWLLKLADALGLGFNQLGKRRHGTPATLYFCDELLRLYGSDNYLTSQAASYAVENWAAAGFWDQLITGFTHYNTRNHSRLPLSFFTWHSRIEAQHALHTQEELEQIYFGNTIDEDKFIHYGNEMLNGVAAFWNGLDQQRKQIA